MKIGIFGGTFDPFTIGHLAIAKEALNQGLVDKVFIVPTICDYYRVDSRKLFTFDEKCRIITEMTSSTNNIILSRVEEGQDSRWRTIDTVKHFRKIFPKDELKLIIGGDSFRSFKTWFAFDDILNLSDLIVANRGEEIKSDIPFTPLNLGDKYEKVSATAVRKNLIDELLDLYLQDTIWYGRT